MNKSDKEKLNKKNKQVEQDLVMVLDTESKTKSPSNTGEDLAKNKFLTELAYRTKDRMNFCNIPSKEQLYKTFVRETLGGKSGASCKLVEPRSVLYSVYESIIMHDKISQNDFYARYMKPCMLPNSAYRMDGNTKSLFLFKKFLTEAIFHADSTEKLCDRMFDDGEYRTLNSDIAGQLTGIDNLEDVIVATAEFCATQIGGNVVILPSKSQIVDANALSRYEKLCNRLMLDYDCVNGKNLFVRKEKIDDHNNSQTVQFDAAEYYKNIVKSYYTKPSHMFSKKDMTREELEETEKKYSNVLSLLEEKMNSQTKEKFEISRVKATVEDFENNMDMVFDTYGMGDYGVEVSKALDAISNPKGMTKKEIATIEKFQKRIDDLYVELKSGDPISKKTLKFFEITKMQPHAFKTLCEKGAENCGSFDKAKASKVLDILGSTEMFGKVGLAMPKEFTSDNGLGGLNMRKARTSGEVIFDYSGEKFEKLVKDVMEYVDKKHLPHTAACYNAVGNAFAEKTARPISAEKNK